jgi:hypothetical protein
MSLFSLVVPPLLPTLHLFVFRAYFQFSVVIYHLNSSLTEVVVSCCRCQTIHNIFFVKLLQHKPTCIVHQVYPILSTPIASDFLSHHRSRLCIPYSSIFSQWPSAHVASLTVYLKKNLRYLGCTWYACCLLLASYDCLTLPSKARRASMGVFALSLPYSPCSSI